jgi:serine/threonine protein kinase/tetratricopeptide (TPR) repeat protein
MVALTLGTRIGPYEIAALLGAGGMGEVYRAVDTRLGRQVAIKVLSSSGIDDNRLRRFDVETRTVSSLQHPNIVALYDVGKYGERPYFVSELLYGETVREHLNRSVIDPSAAVKLAIQLCRGLTAAHDQGIVHRDIKPENLFITHDGVLKILDFGIAKRSESFESEIPEEQRATGSVGTDSGAILGTAGYMSPEQVRGHPADRRSDLFAVGNVLYEMISGCRAFRRETTLESAYAILRDEPPSLSPDLPSALVQIVRTCLEKLPDMRFQSARELAAALEASRLGFDVPVEREIAPKALALSSPGQGLSSQPRTQVRTSRGARTLPSIITAVATTVLATSAIATGSWFAWGHFQSTRASGRISMAVLPFEDFSGDATKEYLADGLTEGMISQIGRLQPERLAVIARTSVAQYRHAKKSVKEIAKELGVQYVLEGSVMHTGERMHVEAQLVQVSDQTQIWADTYEREVKDVIQLQNDVARAIAAQVRLKLSSDVTARLSRARSLNPSAYDAYVRANHFAGLLSATGIRQAISYYEKATSLDPTYAAAYAGLARATHSLPIFTDAPALDVAPTAKAIALHALELDDGLADAHLTLAVILLHCDWDWPGAERHFRRAIQLDPNYPDVHRAYANEYLRSLGRDREAIVELERAVELNPISLLANYMLGATYADAGELDRAIEQLKRTLDLGPDNVWPHGTLAWIYEKKSMWEEALAELEKGGGTADSESPELLATRARLQSRLGHFAESQQALQRADAIAHTTGATAFYFAQIGRLDDAFAKLEEAFQQRSIDLTFLRSTKPEFDSLREDPRYADLARRVGIPEPPAGPRR